MDSSVQKKTFGYLLKHSLWCKFQFPIWGMPEVSDGISCVLGNKFWSWKIQIIYQIKLKKMKFLVQLLLFIKFAGSVQEIHKNVDLYQEASKSTWIVTWNPDLKRFNSNLLSILTLLNHKSWICKSDP